MYSQYSGNNTHLHYIWLSTPKLQLSSSRALNVAAEWTRVLWYSVERKKISFSIFNSTDHKKIWVPNSVPNFAIVKQSFVLYIKFCDEGVERDAPFSKPDCKTKLIFFQSSSQHLHLLLCYKDTCSHKCKNPKKHIDYKANNNLLQQSSSITAPNWTILLVQPFTTTISYWLNFYASAIFCLYGARQDGGKVQCSWVR